MLKVIRSPNYEDITCDIPIENIPLLVGNEHSEHLRKVTLKDYLINFRDYLSYPLEWPGTTRSLYSSTRDSHVLLSAQTCFLPIPPLGGEAEFHVALYNYQSTESAPAVLAIVANEKGTSAQIIDNYGNVKGVTLPVPFFACLVLGQKLYFNNNGQRCSFLAQRLSEHRIEEGRIQDLDQPLNAAEAEKNMILIIQVGADLLLSILSLRFR
jgi:hypothetical protein